MKLFLASQIKHPTTISHLDRFVGGLKGKRLYLLKDGESIEIDGERITVNGEIRIISP